MMRKRIQKKGSVLLEILFAALIFSLGAFPIIHSFFISQKSIQQSVYQIKNLYGEEKLIIERIKRRLLNPKEGVNL